jgi:outer membrane protein insertion porin family
MRQRIVPWAIALLATMSAVAVAQSSRDQQRGSPEVRKLAITGVKSVDWHDLSRSINTRASKCRSLLLYPFCLFSKSPTVEDKYYMDQKEFERDVIRIRVYYWYKGYREAQVDTVVTQLSPKQVGVEFRVTEGPATRIRKLAIVYDSTLISDKTRNRLTLLHAKEPLDLTQLDTMRVSFQNQLWDLGYADALVDTTIVVDTVRHIADVTMTLTPNRRTTIGRLTVSGTHRVAVNTILNSLTFGTGDLYRQSDVLESQRNLYESNLFRLAVIDVPPQYDSVKNVNIDVTEAPLHEARIGPGLSTLDFLQVLGHYTAYNLFGGARRLDLDASVGNLLSSSLAGRGLFRDVEADVPRGSASPFYQPTYNASIDFKQPAFLQRPADQAGFGTFAHRTINPGVFIDQGFGGQATFTHVLAPREPISLNYRYEENRVQASDVYFCMTFGVCDEVTIGALRSHQSLSPLTLTGFVDRSDAPFSPTKGYVARLDIEHASNITGSDYAYTRAFFDGAIYGHKSQTHKVLSGHLRFGLVKALSSGVDGGVLHPRKRFYAGGANSVRGFAESQLGPRVLTIDSTVLFDAKRPLPGSAGGGLCGASIDAVKYCDPNTADLKNSDFFAQPLGGTSLLEGSIEYRQPLPLGETLRHLVGAVFIDGGIIGKGDIRGLSSLGGVIKGTGAITPGFGVRYESPVGPIRVDFGISPNRTEQLTVVTAVADATGARRIVPLATTRRFQQGSGFFSHLVLHFSIGEAY